MLSFLDALPRYLFFTGHTLLLLDTTGSYHREVMRTSEVEAVRGEHAERTALAPRMPGEPVGPERLQALARGPLPAVPPRS